ncbi:MAG TPA: arginine--tRNA ligase [Thermoplasmata archaeon]|nr:arginine--tRNA ligase [Thermoplasmata archaeon]
MTSERTPLSPNVDPWALLLDAVVDGLRTGLGSLGIPVPSESLRDQLETGGGPEGDVAFPTHRLAHAAHRAPAELASDLATSFTPGPWIRAITAKGAYVNFEADPERLTDATLRLVFARGDRYGHADPTDAAVCVEHTSANPTGPFHIGRVRNAIIGDTLARVRRASGHAVTTQYYIDDMGRQAAMITWIWSKPRSEWPEPIRRAVEGEETPGEKPDLHRGRPYPAISAYLKDHEDAREEVASIVRAIEQGRPPSNHRELTQSILSGMLDSLSRLHIRFDEFVWESDFLHDGSVDRVVARLRQAPHALQEPNGAWAIDAGTYGLPKESTHVIFQRSDGTSLYVTRDVAYHLVKFVRFAEVVDVLGQDHQLHARTLSALLTEVGESRRPKFLIYQDITVPEGGRMSTRGGSAVWLDHLLAEAVERARREVLARREDLPTDQIDQIAESVAASAVRYHIVRVAPEKPVVFRWEEALSFEGRSGPFLQYSYARASSVLRKGGVEHGPFRFDASRLTDPEERALIRVIARLPRVVEYAARSSHVQAIAGLGHDLADQFNRFYHAVPVLRSGSERESRIALVAAVRQTLGNTLDLLGIDRLATM